MLLSFFPLFYSTTHSSNYTKLFFRLDCWRDRPQSYFLILNYTAAKAWCSHKTNALSLLIFPHNFWVEWRNADPSVAGGLTQKLEALVLLKICTGRVSMCKTQILVWRCRNRGCIFTCAERRRVSLKGSKEITIFFIMPALLMYRCLQITQESKQTNKKKNNAVRPQQISSQSCIQLYFRCYNK